MIFQRPCLNREFGSSILPAPATQSLDLRLRSIYTRNPCILRRSSHTESVSRHLKIGNFGENIPKVSSPHRRNSRFGGDDWWRPVRSPLRGRAGRCTWPSRIIDQPSGNSPLCAAAMIIERITKRSESEDGLALAGLLDQGPCFGERLLSDRLFP